MKKFGTKSMKLFAFDIEIYQREPYNDDYTYCYQNQFRFYVDEVEQMRNRTELIHLINNPTKPQNDKVFTYEKLCEMKKALKPYINNHL